VTRPNKDSFFFSKPFSSIKFGVAPPSRSSRPEKRFKKFMKGTFEEQLEWLNHSDYKISAADNPNRS
jgi:hypothetical protein